MRRLVLLGLLVTSASHAQPADSVAWGLPAWWDADEQARFLHRSERASSWFGTGQLATTPLPAGTREIRIREVSSLREPLFAYRLVDDHGSVSDHAWLVWGSDADSLLNPFYSGWCAGLHARDAVTVCPRQLPADGLSPTALLDRFERLGLWTLAGEQPAPAGMLTVRGDGQTFVVELRDGPRYRAYTYWSPRRDQEPDEAAAAEIIEAATARAWILPAP
ncbi:MAG TPA: hypothetical protein VF594_03745 [Rubricoccaceae bacterium]|jgi:hypothetical protein